MFRGVSPLRLKYWRLSSQGYESFWAISKTKKGYSGVATYVREGLAAQEALIDFVSASGGPEGRSIATFHQNLVIVNVYVPNG